MVVAGRKPCCQVLPPLREVAQPMLAEAPMKTRPTWKADTMVDPAWNESGSTSVWWAEKEFVYGSVLRWITACPAAAGTATAARSRDTSGPMIPTASLVRMLRSGALDRKCVVHMLRSFAPAAMHGNSECHEPAGNLGGARATAWNYTPHRRTPQTLIVNDKSAQRSNLWRNQDEEDRLDDVGVS